MKRVEFKFWKTKPIPFYPTLFGYEIDDQIDDALVFYIEREVLREVD